jgi:hypothetical protein
MGKLVKALAIFCCIVTIAMRCVGVSVFWIISLLVLLGVQVTSASLFLIVFIYLMYLYSATINIFTVSKMVEEAMRDADKGEV